MQSAITPRTIIRRASYIRIREAADEASRYIAKHVIRCVTIQTSYHHHVPIMMTTYQDLMTYIHYDAMLCKLLMHGALLCIIIVMAWILDEQSTQDRYLLAPIISFPATPCLGYAVGMLI